MGYGFFITFPHFPCISAVSNGLWAGIQMSAAWTVPELIVFWWDGGLRRAGGAGAVWKMVDQLLLSHLRGWKLLFLSLLVKIRHDVGSTSSRYTVYPLTASVSDFVGPTDRLSIAVWVLGCSFFGLQLFSSINPMAFRPNNHVMNTFWAVDCMWVSFGLVNGAETHL